MYIKNLLEPFLLEIYAEARAGVLGMQDPASAAAEAILDVHSHIMYYVIGIFIFVCWMLFYIYKAFYSKVIGRWHSQYHWNKSYWNNKYDLTKIKFSHNSFLETIWTIFPSIVLFSIAIPSFILLYSLEEVKQPAITMKAIGHQWYWSYEISNIYTNEIEIFDSYLIPENELELGEPRLLDVDNPVNLPTETRIRLLVTADDVLHCWAVPELGIKVDAVPGRLNQVELFIKRSGVFYGQCSELCGVNHGYMPIKVNAMPWMEYYAPKTFWGAVIWRMLGVHEIFMSDLSMLWVLPDYASFKILLTEINTPFLKTLFEKGTTLHKLMLISKMLQSPTYSYMTLCGSKPELWKQLIENFNEYNMHVVAQLGHFDHNVVDFHEFLSNCYKKLEPTEMDAAWVLTSQHALQLMQVISTYGSKIKAIEIGAEQSLVVKNLLTKLYQNYEIGENLASSNELLLQFTKLSKHDPTFDAGRLMGSIESVMNFENPYSNAINMDDISVKEEIRNILESDEELVKNYLKNADFFAKRVDVLEQLFEKNEIVVLSDNNTFEQLKVEALERLNIWQEPKALKFLTKALKKFDVDFIIQSLDWKNLNDTVDFKALWDRLEYTYGLLKGNHDIIMKKIEREAEMSMKEKWDNQRQFFENQKSYIVSNLDGDFDNPTDLATNMERFVNNIEGMSNDLNFISNKVEKYFETYQEFAEENSGYISSEKMKLLKFMNAYLSLLNEYFKNVITSVMDSTKTKVPLLPIYSMDVELLWKIAKQLKSESVEDICFEYKFEKFDSCNSSSCNVDSTFDKGKYGDFKKKHEQEWTEKKEFEGRYPQNWFRKYQRDSKKPTTIIW